ncbi:50S ribosomal protein L19, chloroplastic-like protein [Cinnamomum micranthum f. kanehirae]|uniref:50S ribosomal protein L19, chloroplastic-like protein n=1 Tax=Cinnamomum micranthum f. kanehirae TaxID=337451 RepID=A0A443PK04_9MAGN|nr:50S ribosomal protein L19, chloroplastic-like protein [Cinnamomum micranthum f. kanehirae]
MGSFYRSFRHVIGSHFTSSRIMHLNLSKGYTTNCGQALAALEPKLSTYPTGTVATIFQQPTDSKKNMVLPSVLMRCLTTVGNLEESIAPDVSDASMNVAPRIKFKRLDKTARHIMQILDKEAVQEVRGSREVPDIKPGYIVQLKVVVPENKRRASILKGTVIARRNAGLNTTFRLRRLVAGVGVESVFPLYSPNIKEIRVLDTRNKVRRAKLYFLRNRMNALRK